MKKNVVTVYSLFAVIIYIFSVLFFCTSLYKEYSKGKERTVEDFNIIMSRVNREFEKTNSQETLAKILCDFTKSSDKIAEINLENNGRYLFSYPQNPVADSNYIKKFSYSFSSMQNIYNLNAKLYILRPSVIYHYGKISFLIILFVTLITLLLILYTSYSEISKKEPVKASETKENTASEKASEAETNQGQEADKDNNEDINNEEISDESDESEEVIEEDSEAASEESQDEDEQEESATDEDSDSEENTEPSFEKTVEQELNNSIANEKEFAIFVMEVIGIEPTSQEYRLMLELLSDRMKAQGLIFEGKENTIIILKHDTSLDENLALAENTINEIENTYAEFKPICYLGLSNRNQRIVTPQRLMFEAEAALAHAEETEEKVIAFRANTEQYNNFINQQ